MEQYLDLKIINLAHRLDRRDESLRECVRAGLDVKNNIFFSARHVTSNGALGCALSHAKLLADFLFESEKSHILVLEDDFTLRDIEKFHTTINAILRLAGSWDVFLLGHNTALPLENTQVPEVFRIINAQTTSGYLVNRGYAIKLIECFYRSAELLKRYDHLPEMFRATARGLLACDTLWKELQTEARFWATFPSLIYQRPSFSDVENREVSYGV